MILYEAKMPKRRRKLIDSRLKPLVFLESPVSGTCQLQSAVFSSDNPATADVIPVDHSLTWVSPQFTDVPDRSRKHRRKCRNQKTDGMLSSNHSHAQHCRRKVDHKYRPLMFWREGQDNSDSSESECIDDPEGLTRRCPISLVQSSKARINSKCLTTEHCPGENSLKSDNLYKADHLDVNNSCQMDTSLPQCDFDVTTPESAATQVELFPKSNRTEKQFTRIKRRVLDKPQHVQLQSNRRHEESLQNGESVGGCLIEASDCDFDNIPKRRLRHCHRANKEFFPNSQIQTAVCHLNEQMEILVYDTPEEDYGLSVRERRLKEVNRCQNVIA